MSVECGDQAIMMTNASLHYSAVTDCQPGTKLVTNGTLEFLGFQCGSRGGLVTGQNWGQMKHWNNWNSSQEAKKVM